MENHPMKSKTIYEFFVSYVSKNKAGELSFGMLNWKLNYPIPSYQDLVNLRNKIYELDIADAIILSYQRVSESKPDTV
jgi:hypothetical protein